MCDHVVGIYHDNFDTHLVSLSGIVLKKSVEGVIRFYQKTWDELDLFKFCPRCGENISYLSEPFILSDDREWL